MTSPGRRGFAVLHPTNGSLPFSSLGSLLLPKLHGLMQPIIPPPPTGQELHSYDKVWQGPVEWSFSGLVDRIEVGLKDNPNMKGDAVSPAPLMHVV